MSPAARAGYQGYLRERGVPTLVAAGLIGRVPDVLVPTALLLLVSRNGDYLRGGTVVGVWSLTVALVTPFWGRMLSRRGRPQPRLIVLAAAQGLALTALWALNIPSARTAVLILATALTAAVAPPVTAVARNLMNTRFRDSPLRARAFAVEGAVSEIVVVAGTAAGAALASMTATMALVFAGGVRLIGVLALALPSVTGTGYVPQASAAPSPDDLERLTEAGASAQGVTAAGRSGRSAVLVLLAAVGLLLAATGALEIGLVALGVQLGGDWSGWLLTTFAVAGVLGSLASARISERFPTPKLLPLSCCVLALGALMLAAGPALSAVELVGLAVALGTCLGAASTLQLDALGRLAPEGAGLQVFSWVGTVSYASLAGGTLLGGATREAIGSWGIAVLAAGFALLAAVASANGHGHGHGRVPAGGQ